MRWSISVLVIAAMILLAFTGMASAQDECIDVKCTWEPCGEKVDQGEIDAVYALAKDDTMRIMYTDVNSNDRFDNGDALYIDAVLDFNEVEVGDVRLTDYCGTYEPNTKVAHGENDVGLRTKQLPGGQIVVGFVDVNNDEVYDKGDWLYIDTDASSTVTVNDVRLYVDGYLPYSRVTSFGSDQGLDLRDLVTHGTVLTTPIKQLLGYIDSDCSGTWTCVDKLYLQQPFNSSSTATGGVSVADDYVTIGDFRLFIPPAAIQNEGWPECGTKVCQSDIDAVYVLTVDVNMRIMYADTNSNNVFDGEEGLYIDVLPEDINPSSPTEYEVEVGDVRLVKTCGTYDPNTKVDHGDNDLNDRLKELPADVGGQAAVGFVDVNNDGVYDLCDPLYVDTDGDDHVSVRDVRLTPVDGYAAYTRVTSDAGDLGGLLLDPQFAPLLPVTPIADMLGYIDSDCSGTWTCPDKLYLQQMFTEATPEGKSWANYFVTIGDFRLYIPPEAIANESWPECGTKVEQCDIDAVYTLTIETDMRIMYADVNSNSRFDNGDALYIDTVFDDAFDPIYEVEVGDVRLTDYCGTYDPNTKVDHGDNDQGLTLKQLPGGQAVVGFVDVENDLVYDLADWVYVDTDDDGFVSVNDVRLTDVNGFDAYSRVAVGDWDIGYPLYDLVDGVAVPINEPIYYMLGYIDSDCSGTWTCPDKLYLQQTATFDDVTPVSSDAFDVVVSIGDLRLYIPPHEINNSSSSGGVLPVQPDAFDVMNYDTDGSGVIDKQEVFGAIQDYFADEITKDQVFDVIMVYFS